jgi:nucleotide-binding universal stress UspA family protein
MIRRAVVALDGSRHAQQALDLACEVASRFEAELIALHVMSDEPVSEAERKMAEVEFQDELARDVELTAMGAGRDLRAARERLAERAIAAGRRWRLTRAERLVNDAAQQAQARGVRDVRTLLREGDPTKAILEVAQQEGVDLIIMGRRGLSDLAGLLLGSVTHKVTHLAECACLTVK